jgi:hypothetical protein
MSQRVLTTYKTHGIKGFYRGGTALALRQGSNWASRQGLTDVFRYLIKKYWHGNNQNSKLSNAEEAAAGLLGPSIRIIRRIGKKVVGSTLGLLHEIFII